MSEQDISAGLNGVEALLENAPSKFSLLLPFQRRLKFYSLPNLSAAPGSELISPTVAIPDNAMAYRFLHTRMTSIAPLVNPFGELFVKMQISTDGGVQWGKNGEFSSLGGIAYDLDGAEGYQTFSEIHMLPVGAQRLARAILMCMGGNVACDGRWEFFA